MNSPTQDDIIAFNRMEKWIELRSKFEEYGVIVKDDHLKQGVTVNYKNARHLKNTNGVYILTDRDDNVVKIGNSKCIRKRFDILYKHVRNTTNDKIRAYVKDESDLKVWVYVTDVIRKQILDTWIAYTPVYGLERHVIDTYIEAHEGDLPYLNSGRM